MGGFIPGYGGVTAKDDTILNQLKERTEIVEINTFLLKRCKRPEVIKLLKAVLGRRNRILIGISSCGRFARALSAVLYLVNRRGMEEAVFFVMGGLFADFIRENRGYQKHVKRYKRVYVETQAMLRQCREMGLKNAGYFPNCRIKPDFDIQIRKKGERLQCVFFSMIYPEKGTDLILETAKLLPEVDFSFWGAINEDYEDVFLKEIHTLENCCYCGIFDKNEKDVYRLLNRYDILLFLTRCKSEGVPGALIEAKMAGLPAIVSDIAHNREIVEDGVDGIILTDYAKESLAAVLRALDEDDLYLTGLKNGAQKSGAGYSFENYMDELFAIL